MAALDNHGLPITTSSDAAAAHYREGVALLQSTWPGAAERLDAAIEADPDFALAYAARARLHAICAQPGEARRRIAQAERLVSNGTERERAHVVVLWLALNNRPKQALDLALAHLDRWPRDTLIMSLPLGAFGLFAFSGMADHDQARVDLCERHADHFNTDDWWFLANRGWSLVENDDVAHGRAMLERSFELRSQNAQAVHALAHALFEAGAGEDAGILINGWLPRYDRSGILYGHIAWHGALVALERGDVQSALATYEEQIQPKVSKGVPINIVSDVASLLWRIGAYGHEVPRGLWEEIAGYGDRLFPKPGHAFIDTHMLMIAAATGNSAALEQRVALLDEMINAGSFGAGTVVPTIGRALRAFAEGNYAQCINCLEPVAGEVVRIGGSGAQREVIEDTLLIAFMRAGEAGKARALLDRRLHRRPSPRDARWINQLHA